jgi:hypothetical protein
MIRALTENLLHLLIVSPVIFFCLKEKNRETLKVLWVFVIYFLVRVMLLHLPVKYEATDLFLSLTAFAAVPPAAMAGKAPRHQVAARPSFGPAARH